MSRSRSLERMRQSLLNSAFKSAAFILVGSLPASIRPTRVLLAPAKPIKRSTASGGAVHMRSVDSALGLTLIVAASMLRRSLVASNAALTYPVVLTRVERNASGAKRMNHWLNWSTEAAMSFFQRCGLSALIRLGMGDPFVQWRRVCGCRPTAIHKRSRKATSIYLPMQFSTGKRLRRPIYGSVPGFQSL